MRARRRHRSAQAGIGSRQKGEELSHVRARLPPARQFGQACLADSVRQGHDPGEIVRHRRT
jgi:hypothetical protein